MALKSTSMIKLFENKLWYLACSLSQGEFDGKGKAKNQYA